MFPMNQQYLNTTKNMFPANEQYAIAMKNMFPNNEQFANAVRTNLETQVAMLNALTTNLFESIEKVVDLNLNAGRTTLEETSTTARQFFSAKDPQALLSLTFAQAQPTAAKAVAYSRHLAGISSAAQAEFSRITEEQYADKGRSVAAMVAKVSENAPPGMGNAMAIMQTALSNASAGYAQLSKATEQAVEKMQSNMVAAVDQISHAAEQTASTNGRKRKH